MKKLIALTLMLTTLIGFGFSTVNANQNTWTLHGDYILSPRMTWKVEPFQQVASEPNLIMQFNWNMPQTVRDTYLFEVMRIVVYNSASQPITFNGTVTEMQVHPDLIAQAIARNQETTFMVHIPSIMRDAYYLENQHVYHQDNDHFRIKIYTDHLSTQNRDLLIALINNNLILLGTASSFDLAYNYAIGYEKAVNEYYLSRWDEGYQTCYGDFYMSRYEEGQASNLHQAQAERTLLTFTGAILGAILSFVWYVGTEINIFGVNLMHVLMLSVGFGIVVIVFKKVV